jgi:hypothetical protein
LATTVSLVVQTTIFWDDIERMEHGELWQRCKPPCLPRAEDFVQWLFLIKEMQPKQHGFEQATLLDSLFLLLNQLFDRIWTIGIYVRYCSVFFDPCRAEEQLDQITPHCHAQ